MISTAGHLRRRLRRAPARVRVTPAHSIGDQSAVAYMAQRFVQGYTQDTSAPPPPDRGPCLVVGDQRPTLIFGGFDDVINTCTVSPATQVIVNGYAAACSNVEKPPFYGADERAQRACAIQSDLSAVSTYDVIVDHGPAVSIRGPRFWIVTPQQSFHLPPDNVFSIPERDGTLVAHTWAAAVRGLRPGRHVLTVHLTGPDLDNTGSRIIAVRPGT